MAKGPKFNKIGYNFTTRDNLGIESATASIQAEFATVFDAIMLATAFAERKNISIPVSEHSVDKISLLFADDDFKKACSAHTTDSTAIRTRVEKAAEILYGFKI